MQHKYLVLDFDDTFLLHPEGFGDSFTMAYAKAAKQLGFQGDIDEAFRLTSESFDQDGTSVHAFEKHGISAHDLFEAAHDIFLDEAIPLYEEEIKAQGKELLPLLANRNIDVAILSHGHTKYVKRLLEVMEIPESIIPNHRIIGFEQYDFESKAESRLGYKMALGALGLDLRMLRNSPLQNQVFFADDNMDNLRMASSLRFKTIHTKTFKDITDETGFSPDYRVYGLACVLRNIILPMIGLHRPRALVS